MVFFFDRSVGITIPQALKSLNPGVDIEWHQLHFDMAALDEDWLPDVGERRWIVIGQDHEYHNNEAEWNALVRYGIGCFYLWGQHAPKWDTFRVLARAFDRIVERARITRRPYIYKIRKDSGIVPVRLPHGIQRSFDL